MITAKNDEILEAIKTGDLKKLQTWVESGNRFKGKRYDLTDGNNKALLEAVKFRHFDVVKWLVDECGQKVIPTHSGLQKEIQNYSGPCTLHTFFHSVPDDMNTIAVAVGASYFDIAEWLLQHTNNNMSQSDLRLLFLHVFAAENFDFFRSFYTYAVKIVGPENLSDQVALNGTFNMIKWMIHDSGQVVDLAKKDYYAVRMMLSRSVMIEDTTTGLAKWLVEESGQIIDCRNFQNWVGQFELPFKAASDDDHNYLLSVKQQQDSLSLEEWAEALKTKKRAKVTRRF